MSIPKRIIKDKYGNYYDLNELEKEINKKEKKH